MSKLLPCPFCGGRADYALDMENAPIVCMECHSASANAEDWNTRHTPEGWQMVPALDSDEHQGLIRFDETIRDDGTYDIDKAMIVRLARKGAIRHLSAGRYELTEVGQSMLAAASSHTADDKDDE